jgi:hypothetical protein
MTQLFGRLKKKFPKAAKEIMKSEQEAQDAGDAALDNAEGGAIAAQATAEISQSGEPNAKEEAAAADADNGTPEPEAEAQPQ